MITTTLDNWQDENHPGDPQAAFDNFGRARTDVNHPRHDEAIGVSLLVLPADLGPAWEDPGHVGQPHYSTWMVPPLPFVHHKDWSKERALFGYSVLDLRDGGFQLYPPVRDMPVSGSGGPYTATSVRREVWEHQPEPTPGAPAAAAVLNRVLHGGSSIDCFLLDMDPQKGRWYPYAMEGVCPGQQLVVTQPGTPPQRFFVTVQNVGWDAEHRGPDGTPHPLPYFTAIADPRTPLPPGGVTAGPTGVRIKRKTFLGTFWASGEDHTPNQMAGALSVNQSAYSDGDSFGSAVHLTYQGDFMAAGGDEGGLGASYELRQDVHVFSGTVEDFRMVELDPADPQSLEVGQLTYGTHVNTDRIGAGRPIINMDVALTGACSIWLTDTYPGKRLQFKNGVVEIPNGSLPDNVVGRFFAIDEPSERIDPNDSFCKQAAESRLVPDHVMWRWFQITSMVRDPDNSSQLLQFRYKRWDAYEGGPDLIDTSHYASHHDPRPVHFVIRPGAIPFDVSRAVAENDNVGVPRIMLMQPNADMVSGEPPFAKGNRIEQALGSRCWNPMGVRIRHLSAWPSQLNAPDVSFLTRNLGTGRVGIGLLIDDNAHGNLDKARTMYRGGIGFERGVSIAASTQRAIAVSGDVAQLNGDRFKGLPSPDAGVALLLNQAGKDDISIQRARKAIAWTVPNGLDLMTMQYDGKADVFRIAGAATVALRGTATLDLGGAKIVNAAPRVLRGTSVIPGGPAPTTPLTARVDFPTPMADGYVAVVSPSWVTGFGVSKDQAGLTIEFEKPPPTPPQSSAGWTFDWMVQLPD